MKAMSFMALSLFLVSQTLHAVPANSGVQPAIVKAAVKAKIDLNTADVATLNHSFKGIGKKRAEAIVQYRLTQKFNTIEDLANVKGFSKSFVTKNSKQLSEVFVIS